MRVSFHRKNSDLALILDIGTESVKAVLYEKKEGRTVISAVSREYFDEWRVWDGFFSGKNDIALAAIARASERAIRAVVSQAGKDMVIDLFVALPPETSHAGIVTMSFERKDAHPHISKAEEQEILAKGTREGKEIIQKMAQELYGIEPQGLSFLVFRPVFFSIDGYRVSSLRNFNGRRVVWSALGIAARKDVLPQSNFFTSLVHLAKDFKMNFSSPNVIFLAECMANIAALLEDGIYIDIGGKETQVFVIQQKTLVCTFDFPFGASSWVEVIKDDLGILGAESREILERYSRGTLTQETATRLKELLGPSLSEWFHGLQGGLEKADYAGAISGIFIFGGGSMVPAIKEVLESSAWQDSFIGSPRAANLLPDRLPHLEYRGKAALTSQYIPSFILTYHGSAEKKIF